MIASLALAACTRTTWREVDVRQVSQRDQVFVVTTGAAYVFEVSAHTGDTLQGKAVRAWSFPSIPFALRETESPDEIARRLGWTPTLAARAPTSIRLADIRYTSSESDGDNASRSAGFLGGLIAALVVIPFLLILLGGPAHK